MPIYEYECSKCGVIEVTQSITKPPINKCPNCRRRVKRLISLNNFHLKGTGWYSTGYSRKGNGDSNDGKKPAPEKNKPKTESPSKSSGSEKTESKATSTESKATSTDT